jgi:hypothetical protein
VLMRAARDLPANTPISVMIEWPAHIDDAAPLALHIYGTIVRSESGLAAIRFSVHEWRPRTKHPGRQIRTDRRGRFGDSL